MNKKDRIDKFSEFRNRLAEIHRLDASSASQQTQDGKRDIRREELQAMVDVFLGKNYDRKKFRALDNLQKIMHQQHSVLFKYCRGGNISSAQFFDLQTALFAAIFREIKKVIGAQDYRKLFGANFEPQLVHRKTFLKFEAERKNKKV